MTISTTYAPVQYIGNAVTTAFSFPYPFFDDTDLLVYLDGVLQASGYTVTGGSGASGTVTFSSAPASGVIVTIELSIPYTQLDDYVENQAFPADTLESGLDRAAMRDQQIVSLVDRSLRFPTTLTGSLVGVLPQPEDGKILSWDGESGAVANTSFADLSTSIDTVFTSLTTGDYLYYNGTHWVNDPLSNDTIQASSAAGVVLKNSAGTTVGTFGASAGTVTALAGNLTVAGTSTATGSIAVAGTSSSPAYFDIYEDTDNGTNKITLIAPSSITSDKTITLPDTTGTVALTSDIPTITSWVAYTPTFTGFGTATNIEFFSRRVGDTLEINGRVTAGTVTATEARITMGFNGTDGNVTSSSTKIASVGPSCVGVGARSSSAAATIVSLAERSVTYFTLGIQSGSTAGATKANANSVVGTGETLVINARVPISGW